MLQKIKLLGFCIAIFSFVFSNVGAAAPEESGSPAIIFEDLEGGIVVHSPNPAYDKSYFLGYSFLVDLDLPIELLNPEDGYFVWIIPENYSSPEIPAGGKIGSWTHPSALYEPDAKDIERSGWLYYENENQEYIHVERGTVESWTFLVEKWDGEHETQVEFYRAVFDFKAVID